MPNTVYSNFYLSNEVEDQFKSHLDLVQFCTIDDSLVGTAGMKRVVNVYKATDGTEKLTKGQGNSKSITVGFTPKEYVIILAQNKFTYHDEEEMTDPMIVPVGMKHAGTDLFNTVNGDIYTEFKKATLTHQAAKFDFGAFADAVAKLNFENLEDVNLFAFVHPTDVATLRKELKEDLKYVEAFAKQGYIGSVAGVNVYTKKDADKGTIIIATKKAVTMFVKKGIEVEQARDKDKRINDIFSRKYYYVAFTNETQAVKLTLSPGA